MVGASDVGFAAERDSARLISGWSNAFPRPISGEALLVAVLVTVLALTLALAMLFRQLLDDCRDHNKQRSIAHHFQAKSKPEFDCCAGAIDGMLVWTEKPSVTDCHLLQCGSGRFMCGRKGKFGLNLQGVCDAHGHFIDVWITNPASSSDYIAFIRSDLFTKLNQPGFLAEGLALFGDNACAVCTDYMVTPYSNVREGPKDDFNFFQSQLRINVECAFGMLVQRWSILRRPLPSTRMGVKKQICLVMALCKLHISSLVITLINRHR
jgi:hypothetical protein